MRAFLMTLFLSLFASQLVAESPVPERRVIISRDLDLVGVDLQSIFDTNLDACQAACVAEQRCEAFTFNRRSNSCFLKSDVTGVTEYERAVSARLLHTDPVVLAQAEARAADLSFLSEGDFAEAKRLGTELGRLHSSDERDAVELLRLSSVRYNEHDLVAAYRFTGAALAVSDRADLWVEYGRLARTVANSNGSQQNAMRRRAIPAAINGYLRARNNATRTAALIEIASGLESRGRGRTSIDALRLAQEIQPRRDTEAALERAISRFGFRVRESYVQSDSATPRICVEMSEALDAVSIDYAPFVQLPDEGLTVDATGNELCIEGVIHGERYRFVLRKGMPALSGEELFRPVELTFYVRDRTPAVRFSGRAYVLPRLGDAALPIESVNLDEVDLQLSRMTDRNLIRSMQEDMFGEPLYEYQQETFDNEMAEVVWSGTGQVHNDLNIDMTTRLPMQEAIAGQPAGIYVLQASVAGADAYDSTPATQWFILSDLGIATMLGTDGLTVVVRGLGDAAAKAGAEVTLMSRSNSVLGTAVSDAEGVATFDAGLTRGLGGAAPGLVTVTDGAGDMAFLSLTGPSFDLSDRGVEGLPAAPPIDVFLTTDRGAYRAGEVIHVTALMRDQQAAALPGIPLTAVLYRPDGVEYSRHISTDDMAGGHVFALPVANTVPRGAWRIAMFTDVKALAMASTTVLVEDFLPERIDFEMAMAEVVRIDDMPPLTITAKYLFGPPASDLPIEGEALLRAASRVEGFEGYAFGRHDDRFEPHISGFSGQPVTGPDGVEEVDIVLSEVNANGHPLEVQITARVSEGSGRPVERRIVRPVLSDTSMIGIKPMFDEVAGYDSDARFNLIAVSPDLQPEEMQVRWTLNRVHRRYQWYNLNGRWRWEPTTSRTLVTTGVAALGATPVEISAHVDWGSYELVVERADGEYLASSTQFYAGWYAPADAGATPDFLDVSLDKPAYQPGDTAVLRLVPRYAGTAIVTVMSNQVVSLMTVEVPEGESTLNLPVTDEWGAGVYVTASVIRPMDVDAGRNPARSLGLAYAPVDPGDKHLDVSLDWPEGSGPREPLAVTLEVNGGPAEDTVYVTLAGVDLGILNLTGFESPDPANHYFGQRRLGVEMRDIYGQLIDGMSGSLGSVRSGGDALADMRMESPPPTEELVVFFEGPVAVDAAGRAEITFDMPAFNGTLRLMAVAWSEHGVGQAEADVVLRDPVVLTASVPRFMAPGDRSRLLLEVIHADGPTGSFPMFVTADGVDVALPTALVANLATPGAKDVIELPIFSDQAGVHTIEVGIEMPDGKVLSRVLTLPVMANDPEVARTSRFTLAAGDTFTFDRNVFAGLVGGTGFSTLSVGPLARFDAPGLLNALDRYPYGCTEQLTSRAMPLLYFDSVAEAMGMASRDAVGLRINQAIREILGNQAANGSFGLWGPYSGDLWLDAYVTDFLSRARAQGYDVPDIAFNSALDNVRNRVNFYPDFDSGGQDLAYGLMVLAREGAAAIGDLRYYADERPDAFTSPLGAAQIGAALAFYGDQTRADRMFGRAGNMLARRMATTEDPIWRIDYGTSLRDEAAVLALAVEAGTDVIDRELLATRISRPKPYRSTQESTWTLMAANALISDISNASITVDGQLHSGPLVRVIEDQVAGNAMLVRNTGERETELTLTTYGVPSEPEPAGGNGYKIERGYFTMEGEPVDISTVKVGARMVVVLTVQPLGRREGRLMVDDPLPAGFEIDNPNLLRGGDVAGFDWLDPISGENAEFRTERFLAAVDWRRDESFQLAYVVRAVTPGSYHHPAASVEDMYRPTYRARSDVGRVTVTQ